MVARRALLETEPAIDDPSLIAFQRSSARRGLVEEPFEDALVSVDSAPARRAISMPVSFEPDEPLTSTRRLPKIVDAKPLTVRRSLRLRRGLLSVAAAVTASAVLVVPNAMSTTSAQPAPAAVTSVQERVEQPTSRDAVRAPLAEPVTLAAASARAVAARVAEEERIAAEQAAAEAEAARIAEEQRLAEEAAAEAARIAEEERIAAEQAAAEAAAAQAAAAPAPAVGGAPAINPAPAAAAAPPAGGYCAYGDGSGLGL
ncbi:MAG: hypothetical protein Q4G35_14385, partial [Propionibacteriaceae bacterium]|nr:hypothetical protein [Propionibacteriaceae bacterium]